MWVSPLSRAPDNARVTSATLCGDDASLNECVETKSTGTKECNDKREDPKSKVELVTGRIRPRIDPCRPGHCDHRHHHVPEQSHTRQARTEAESQCNSAPEFNQPPEDGEQPAGVEVGGL